MLVSDELDISESAVSISRSSHFSDLIGCAGSYEFPKEKNLFGGRKTKENTEHEF